MRTHPRSDLFQQLRGVGHIAELLCGETEELVGLGVSARPQVHRQVVVGHRCRVGGTEDGGGVLHLQIAHPGVQHVDAASVRTADLFGRHGFSVQFKGQRFDDLGPGMRGHGDLELQIGLAGDVDVEMGGYIAFEHRNSSAGRDGTTGRHDGTRRKGSPVGLYMDARRRRRLRQERYRTRSHLDGCRQPPDPVAIGIDRRGGYAVQDNA